MPLLTLDHSASRIGTNMPFASYLLFKTQSTSHCPRTVHAKRNQSSGAKLFSSRPIGADLTRLESMVGLVRLELTTSRLSSARSNQLSYKPEPARLTHMTGGGNRTRTDDPLLAKQMLSQLSYAPRKLQMNFKRRTGWLPIGEKRCTGGGCLIVRIRTVSRTF